MQVIMLSVYCLHCTSAFSYFQIAEIPYVFQIKYIFLISLGIKKAVLTFFGSE